MITTRQIIDVSRIVHSACQHQKAKYALLGGGLFQLLGLEDYRTADLDYASDSLISETGKIKDNHGDSSSGWENHFLCNGVNIDWLVRSKTEACFELYKHALAYAYLHEEGFFCATLEHAIAIRRYPEREKDFETIELLSPWFKSRIVNKILADCGLGHMKV